MCLDYKTPHFDCYISFSKKFYIIILVILVSLEENYEVIGAVLSFNFRHILAIMHFNFNLQRDLDIRKKDSQEKIKITYPKFKNGEATVRNVRVKPIFGKSFPCIGFSSDYI